METTGQLPFQSFSFTLIEGRRPRLAFRMALAKGAEADSLYEVQVQRGSAANATTLFRRQVPLEIAQRLKDNLQAAGVFAWDESYGDTSAPGSMRWSVSTVFKEGVFSVAASGGSDVPAGFDALLEELYRLDFPRPEAAAGSGLSDDLRFRIRADAAGLGKGVPGLDFSQLADAFKDGGMPGFDMSQMQEMLSAAQSNPQALQQRMRDEFQHLSREEQDRMLDMLASMGTASRAWWERFLRG